MPGFICFKIVNHQVTKSTKVGTLPKRLAVLGVLRALVVQKPFRDKVAELATFLITVASAVSS